MPMQTGVGFSKILLLVGAGYTGAMLFKNIKFSDVLGKLQSLVKELEKSSDAVAVATYIALGFGFIWCKVAEIEKSISDMDFDLSELKKLMSCMELEAREQNKR